MPSVNLAFLAADFVAGQTIDFLFGEQNLGNRFDDRQANFVSVFANTHFTASFQPAMILCEMSVILSRDNFMLSPESRPDARMIFFCEIRVFLILRNMS